MAGNPQQSTPRPPVVAILGHIDHGKSTLLDYIRKTNVIEREAGGITQHISAYEAEHAGRKITFIDTPGHEAFSKMRSRGASAADIAILVVSGVEGVEPQTLEALDAINRAKIPYIVAINKVDRTEASVERAKQSLAEKQIYLEGYGGQVPAVATSAKTGTGVPELLDMILLVADLHELKGNPSAPAEGLVIESNLDPRKGSMATVIIRDGTLRRGMFLAVGDKTAKVKILENFLGRTVEELGPSSPARVVGFEEVPEVGSHFKSFETKDKAEVFLETLDVKKETSSVETEKEVTIPTIIRADVAGSLEAVETMLKSIETESVGFKLVASGVGKINDGDMKTALATQDPLVIAFHTDAERVAKDAADQSSIQIHKFDIIYKLKEWLVEELEERRPRQKRENILGQAKIVKIFSQSRTKQVVGGKVEEGSISSGKNIRIKRHDHEIGQGKIVELEQQKVKVNEVKADNMFGALVDSKITLAPGDVLEIFEIEEV